MKMQKLDGGGVVFDTPEEISAYRLITLKAALKMEITGVRFKGGRLSAFKSLQTLGYTQKTRQAMLVAVTADVEKLLGKNEAQ